MSQMPQEVVDQILSEINAANVIEDAELQAFADELSDPNLTAEREAAIAEALPAAYVSKKPARAQLDGDYLTVPKYVTCHGTKVNGEWNIMKTGRRMQREKMDCVVGQTVELDLPEADLLIVRLAVLWRRAK